MQIEAVYANREGLYSLYKEVLEELLVLLYNELENESKIAEIEILKKYQVETILNHYSDMGKQKNYLSL
ncbi:hypothetical protein ACPYIV_20205 [Parabacteroides sp. ASD2025]|uniref:hypothetical protein n=1 Tax=Parabacteroides sp. ASD2025 TaxID=3415987 RepID=UPI003CF8E7B5